MKCWNIQNANTKNTQGPKNKKGHKCYNNTKHATHKCTYAGMSRPWWRDSGCSATPSQHLTVMAIQIHLCENFSTRQSACNKMLIRITATSLSSLCNHCNVLHRSITVVAVTATSLSSLCNHCNVLHRSITIVAVSSLQSTTPFRMASTAILSLLYTHMMIIIAHAQ